MRKSPPDFSPYPSNAQLGERQALTLTRSSGTCCTVTLRKTSVRSPLTELENEVMSAVWNAGPSSVESVHQAVSHQRRLKEATIRTLLRRLEQKGYLRHHVEGRAFIYRATEPARSLAA